jgi:hypothetical protein
MFYDITGIASLRYITTVLVNNNNFINNGSILIFCIIWNDCLQCFVFVPWLTKTATRRTIGWVGHSSIGKGEMITKCWSGKGMKRPFWKYTRKYEGNIAIDLQWTIYIYMYIYIFVCVCVRERESERGRERELESPNSRLGGFSHRHCIERNETACWEDFLEYRRACQLVKKTSDTRN